MIFRTQDEIQRKLNRMEAPVEKFMRFKKNHRVAVELNTINDIQKEAFVSGYNQAVKEMKEYFNIKGNGIHRRYEE